MIEEKREFLYFDSEEQQKFLEVEEESNKELKKIVDLVYQVLGTSAKIDFEALIENGLPFLINDYKKRYLEYLPPHVDFDKVVRSQVPIDLEQITKVIDNYKSLVSRLGEDKPNISTAGKHKTNITEENFKKYLTLEKTAYYKYMNDFIVLAERIKDFKEPVDYNHIVIRFFNQKGIRIIENKLVLDLPFFTI
jgi:hypothetical protein